MGSGKTRNSEGVEHWNRMSKIIMNERMGTSKKAAAASAWLTKHKNKIVLVIFALSLGISVQFLGLDGLWLFLAIVIGLALYKIIRKWDHFMAIIKYIETILFGKPLDKDMWDKGEFKNRKRKIRIVWRKKNDK